mmetsp:Transcript_36943/g.102629  ORF Transcript_36943/g.102629 Transcript_36943/m.102629 type:complete len:207 (+) Transcript_36943:265-885(+)
MMLRQVSKPMKSASVSGPMGTLVPRRMVLSMSSAVAMPSCSANTASLMYGIRMRFATNPGRSSLVACSFFMSTQSWSVRASVASSVRSPRITSTRGITGTGFMKCIPMKRSGRSTAAPSFVMEMDEVFVASTLSERSPASCSDANTACLTCKSSLTASITKSRLGTSPRAPASSSAPYWIRRANAADSSSVSRPFFSSLAAQSWTN